MDENNFVDLAKVVKIEAKNEDKDELPESRSGHRIVVTSGALYSVGGYNPKYWDLVHIEGAIYPLFNELWKFNFSTMRWLLLKTEGEMPVEMASHTALLIGNKLFVHGGTGTPFGHASSNQLNVCDLDTLQWRHIETIGELPEKLYGHSIALVKPAALFMFGGTTGFEYRSDLHKLNLVTRTWEQYKIDRSVQIPSGRYRHEMVCDGDYLFVLGGGRSDVAYGFEKIDAFKLSDCRWEQLTCLPSLTGGFPPARRCHAAVRYKKGAYISGGYNGIDVFDDVWRLDLETLQWSRARQLAEPVYFHSIDVTPEGCMYIFGGVNRIDDRRNSDIYRFWVDTPSLLEQSWQAVSELIPNLDSMDRDELRALGIPEMLLARLTPNLAKAC